MNGAVDLLGKGAEGRTRELGSLCVSRDGKRVSLPLAGVRISARVADRVAEVTVVETFRNPFREALEAVYIFPLGGGSAVSAFELKVDDRVIRGVVKERGAARAQYEKALRQGKRAALLEQERDDVFTVQVGNLPPGDEAAVTIVYSERLPFFEDGTTELRLPLVVAPRYIPGQPLEGDSVGRGTELDTDQVPDASRITPPRLAPGFDPRVAISIEVELADGVPADLASSQHAVKMAGGKVALSREGELLNRDFILRWRLAGAAVRPSLLVYRDGQGRSYGMLTITPPRRDGFLGLARDVVFLLDRSGSMEGKKMASAARACAVLLSTLGPRDRFSICAFDDTTEWHGRGFVPADEGGLAAGERFLRGIGARGGTELDPALGEAIAAIGGRRETAGRMPVVVLITDGQVGNESEILKRVRKEIGDARVFAVGIDTAVNEPFLRKLAAAGGGTATFCVPGESLEEALRKVGREIGSPLVVDLSIEGVDNVAPARVPDLFAGRAATAFFTGDVAHVRVRGKLAGGGTFDERVTAREVALPAIAQLWARARVTDLEDRFRLGEDVRKEIIDISVRHSVLTRFTAFVVVDESEIVNPTGQGRTVVQPVEMPAEWEMDKEECRPAAPPAVISFHCEEAAPLELYRATSRARRMPGPAKPKAAPEPKVSKAEREAVRKAIEKLSAALEAARAAFDRGALPSAGPIEEARQELLEALADGEIGSELPELQRFLRSTLVEFLAALGAADPAGARGIWDRVEKEWALVNAPNSSGKFWEASV